jgi:hypothetical protein
MNGVYKMELLKPKEFWVFVESVCKDVEEWVRYNKKHINYECCGQASSILYRLLVDWGIGEYPFYEKGTLDDIILISVGAIRNTVHHWVEVLGYIYDPTKIQFNPSLDTIEYTTGWKYNDYEYDCKKIFESEELEILCRAIRPDIYYK